MERSSMPMPPPAHPRRPAWHAEVVHLEGELRRLATEIEWARRAAPPRREAGLRRDEARLRRRVARLRELLGLPAAEDER